MSRRVGAGRFKTESYNSATNTTTASIAYWPTDGSGLQLNFGNTKRTPSGPINTGVTNIKLMRPITPGSTVSYDPSVTFTQPLKDLVSKFSVVRMMDDTGTNGDRGQRRLGESPAAELRIASRGRAVEGDGLGVRDPILE